MREQQSDVGPLICSMAVKMKVLLEVGRKPVDRL